MSMRKRSGSGSKRLKEKVVVIYESFFKGEDPQKSNPAFWDELFLLKPKIQSLENEVQSLNAEQLGIAKDNINTLFANCIESLEHENNICVLQSMQTLCGLVHAVYKKTTADSSGIDVVNLLIGLETAEVKMQKLLGHCHTFLTGDYPDTLKSLCLKLLLVFLTGTDNVSQNMLIEYIMVTSLFECFMQLLCDTSSRQLHGHDVVLLLTLIVNYRKHEGANPYIVKLSILDDELALNGYGQVITASLADFCRCELDWRSRWDLTCRFLSQYALQQAEAQNAGWLASFTNLVGNIFISDDMLGSTTLSTRAQRIRANNALLLALHEAVHLNRHFITTLAQTQTDGTTGSQPPSPSNTLSQGQQPPGSKDKDEGDQQVQMVVDIMTQPANLLVTFFQYCSIVMQDTKTESGTNTIKLCFLILTCISEDQYANSLMHDISLTFKVQLYKLPMRHRKIIIDKSCVSQPLASTLLDLLVEFIMTHMVKKLPSVILELYLLCIGVIHRILCYEKRCRVRINYQWKDLWTALITLLKFLVQNDLSKKMNTFDLCLQIINLLNLFILYGDTFLPTPGSYDELYYELIRMHKVFEDLHTMAMRYATGDGEFKDNAQKLINSLINIRSITKHFELKINNFLHSLSLSTPSEDQILDVVRKNYDSLTLKLQDSLDQYERYAEKPKHSSFFTTMVRSIVSDTRTNIDYVSTHQ